MFDLFANPRPMDRVASATTAAPRPAARATRGVVEAIDYAIATGAVLATAMVSEVLHQLLDLHWPAIFFLGNVVGVGILLGTRPALLSAVLSAALYSMHLTLSHPEDLKIEAEDYVTLVAFVVVAVVTGSLAGRAREAAMSARADQVEALFASSRALLTADQEHDVYARLSDSLAHAVDGEAVVVAPDGDLGRFTGQKSESHLLVANAMLSKARLSPAAETQKDNEWRARRMQVGDESYGVAIWRLGNLTPEQIEEIDQLADVIVDLAGSALARAKVARDRAALEAAANADKLRAALMSSISHDLRTPLTSIMTSANSLREHDQVFTSETRVDLASNIEEEAERLSRYVTNLLSMTRLEAGALTLRLQTLTMDDVVRGVVKRIERRRGVSRVKVETNADLLIRADPLFLDQALTNVIENAIKYVPEGEEILVVMGHDAEENRACIEVRDSGPGVPEELRERIFDKFYRADTREAGQGAGLGLAISRGLVQAMGGDVRARARLDGKRGLSVVFFLVEAYD